MPVQFLTSEQRANYGRAAKAGGYLVRDEDVAWLSLFVHERHINILGHHSFAAPEAVTRDELRALRNPNDADALTAFYGVIVKCCVRRYDQAATL